MRAKQLFISLILGLGLTLALLWLLGGGAPSAHADSPHYVAPGGICGGVTPCHATIQEAVDAAVPGDGILVAAGTYTGVNNYGGLAQVVYISKTITIQGGYTTTNWTAPYPITQPTTLDAQGQGRVFYITGEVSPTIEGLHITGGDADGLGGDPFDMGSAGGGVYIITATATLSNNQMFSSTANFGGGLFLYFSPAVLSRNTIMSNATTVSGGGGGLFLYRSSAVLSENTVISNTAYQGGGLYLNNSAAILSENTIMSNTAAVGGGLSVDGSDATLSGDTIASNTATGNGGGLRLYASNIALINAIIADNQAGLRGSGLFINASSPHLLHTTIAHNSGGDGSGVHVTAGGGNSTVALTNTILVSHTVGITVTAGNPFLAEDNTAALESTLWYSNTIDWGGAGNIFTGTVNVWGDPAFVSPDDGDYHITAVSAARDAGVDAGVTDDIDGDPRPQGGGYDIGADEFLSAAPGDHKIYLPLIMRQYP